MTQLVESYTKIDILDTEHVEVYSLGERRLIAWTTSFKYTVFGSEGTV
jgi:hypothetical protein